MQFTGEKLTLVTPIINPNEIGHGDHYFCCLKNLFSLGDSLSIKRRRLTHLTVTARFSRAEEFMGYSCLLAS